MNERERERSNAIVVGVGGFSSNAGKTTLMCELLRAFPGWEAVKLTRGHYRSCGKDAHACCVSHLLRDEPSLRTGRDETYAPGKDTGRYWDAGASNVHWVIATDAQVEEGIGRALRRVRAAGVFVESNSFLKYRDADFFIMAARARGDEKIKPTARRALASASALYLFDEAEAEGVGAVAPTRARFAAWLERSGQAGLIGDLPVYTRENLPSLVERVREAVRARVLAGERAFNS